MKITIEHKAGRDGKVEDVLIHIANLAAAESLGELEPQREAVTEWLAKVLNEV